MTRAFSFVPPKNPQPLGQMLDVQAARDPQRPALTCGSTTLTRGELALRARARALALQKLGVQEGDFVALALPNGTAVLELAFGCWMLGATPTPLSHRLPALELQAMIDVLQPRIAVVDERSVFDDANANSPLPARISPHVKAIASGGSTGRPKIIVDHTRAVLDPDAPSVGMRATDTVIIPGPMYHSAPFGLAYQALGWGCHVVIMPRFDAAETLRLVAAHRAQWLYQVPTMMHRIWRLDSARADYDVSSLELVCHIAAACPAWLKEKWIEWLGPDRVWEVYSGTEALGATVIGGRDWLEHRGSVGRLAPGASVRILDEAGDDVTPGEIGEIYFRPAGGRGSPSSTSTPSSTKRMRTRRCRRGSHRTSRRLQAAAAPDVRRSSSITRERCSIPMRRRSACARPTPWSFPVRCITPRHSASPTIRRTNSCPDRRHPIRSLWGLRPP